jgi:methyl-accepting chemotaxis protein
MMRSFSNLKIRNKVLLGYVAVFIVSGAVGALSVVQIDGLDAIAQRIDGNVSNLIQLGNIRADGAKIGALASLGMISATASESLDQFNGILAQEKRIKADFERQWKALSATMDEGAETADARTFNDSFKTLYDIAQKSADAVSQGNFPDANRLILNEMGGTIDNFVKAAAAAIAYEKADSLRLEKQAQQQKQQSLLIIGLGIALLLLSILVSVALSIGQIARPIARMTEAMRRLSRNEMEITLPGLGQRDEIGAMAAAVQVFKENALERTKLEAEAAEFQRDLDRKLRETEQAFTEAGREQKVAMEGVTAALARLAAGDLTARFDRAVGRAYQGLKDDFNAALSNLQETMRAIAGSTGGVRSGASEIQQAAGDLSHRTEQQAASLEETAAALDEITATVRKTAESVNEARRLVQDARGSAEHSGTVVRDAVQAMGGIEQSSRQIANIISVIDEIAFQTNLLALNAGVEAARAGDAGRGFAVVATEVRTLAQRSADAAKEIKTLILSSGQQVELGVKLVSDTGEALSVIVDQVMRLNGLMADVAHSAQEQSTGLQQVNTTMNQMDRVTQQNAAMVEEATAASHGLAREADELAQIVGKFTIEPAEGWKAEPSRPPASAHHAGARLREGVA